MITQGSPTSKVTIYTDEMKFNFVSAIGDSNSDILSKITNKSLMNPAGSFTITFVPNLDSKGRTWFNKLDAHDYVEIEFNGINNTESKVVMRGLIDSVTKQESFENNEPQRTITINGSDLGSLLTKHNIYYIPEMGQDDALAAILTVLAWKRDFPVSVDAAGAFDFISDRFKECVDVTFNGVPLRTKLGFAADSMYPEDKTNLFHLMGYEGTFWNSFQQYLDKPFHELFVYDGLDMSWLVLRPSRLKDAKGNYHKSVETFLQDSIFYPKSLEISNNDLVSINVAKNQDEIFNYYITMPTLALLSKESFRGVCLSTNRGQPQDSENPFFQIDPTLPAYIGKYGFRKLEMTTTFVNLDYGQRNSRGKNYEKEVLVPAFVQHGIERNRTAVAWFLHNEHLLTGSMDILGNNEAIIGIYVVNKDDGMEYYIENVSHSYVTLQSFRTTLGIKRGQPTKEKGGLVGTEEISAYNDWEHPVSERLNRYYFGGIGRSDVSALVTMKSRPSIMADPKDITQITKKTKTTNTTLSKSKPTWVKHKKGNATGNVGEATGRISATR